jgi:hypothetical protein
MKPTRTRSLSVAAAALALSAVTVASPLAGSYAASRPHTRDDLVAHAAGATDPRPLPVAGLTVGDVPAIAYAFASKPEFGGGNWRLHRPDGTVLRLPELTWGAWAPMGDGAIGMAGTEAGPELQQVSGDGRVRTRMVEHFGLAISPDHEIVSWLGDHGTPHVVEGGGTRRFDLPRPPHGRAIAAVQGVSTCKEQSPEGGGCAVFVNGSHRVWVSDSHGLVDSVRPLLQVSDVNQSGRLAGLMSRRTSQRPACWGVFRANGHRAFRTCDYYLDSFSPDGRRVLAERSQVRWASIRRFAILDRDGQPLQTFTFHARQGRSLTQLTWEDSDHLLGVLQAHGRWSLVRIGTDGAVEYAGAPVDQADELSPYDLPRR